MLKFYIINNIIYDYLSKYCLAYKLVIKNKTNVELNYSTRKKQ